MYDCALFDVDGVLVNIRKSYNSAIKKTVEFILSRLSGRSFRGIVTDEIILRFRQTGGFNNDTDTTYAISLAMLSKPPKNTADGRKLLFTVAENADETGIESVEKFLANHEVQKWKDTLAYPAPVRESMLARVFDEFFYGPQLFRRQNHLEPRYWKGRPLIKNDIPAVTASTMRLLYKAFGGRLAMVTGRSQLAAKHSLKGLIKYFDLEASVFLEDEKREYAKPNPYAIKKAMKTMGASSAIYAGDSAEDFLMARRAESETGARIEFVGIYGLSPRPANTLSNFRHLGVDATARTVNQLPELIRTRL